MPALIILHVCVHQNYLHHSQCKMTQKGISSWTNKGTLHSHGPVSIQISLWKPSYFHLETASTHHQTTSRLTVYVHTPMPFLQNWKGSKYWDHNCDSVNILAPKQKLSFLLETEWINIPYLQWRRVLLIADVVHETASSPGTFWDSIGHFRKYHNILCLSPQILHKHCFQFLLGLTMIPRENKNNAYAKFGVTNKEYYGILRNGLYQQY